jgi:hypothetical protein
MIRTGPSLRSGRWVLIATSLVWITAPAAGEDREGGDPPVRVYTNADLPPPILTGQAPEFAVFTTPQEQERQTSGGSEASGSVRGTSTTTSLAPSSRRDRAQAAVWEAQQDLVRTVRDVRGINRINRFVVNRINRVNRMGSRSRDREWAAQERLDAAKRRLGGDEPGTVRTQQQPSSTRDQTSRDRTSPTRSRNGRADPRSRTTGRTTRSGS